MKHKVAKGIAVRYDVELWTMSTGEGRSLIFKPVEQDSVPPSQVVRVKVRGSVVEKTYPANFDPTKKFIEVKEE